METLASVSLAKVRQRKSDQRILEESCLFRKLIVEACRRMWGVGGREVRP